MKVAVIVSAISEWNGVKLLFPDAVIEHYPYGESFNLTPETWPVTLDTWNVTLFHTGWGKTASAGAMQYVIDHHSPDLLVNLGTCGGFAGVVERGDVILVDRTFIYDMVEMMDSSEVMDFYASSLDLGWLAEPYPFPVRRGIIASADSDLPPDQIPFLKSRGAIAADWESASLAWVAQKNDVRLLILRGVSDLVSEQGGEVYDQYEDYKARAKVVMNKLIGQLPEWLKAVKI